MKQLSNNIIDDKPILTNNSERKMKKLKIYPQLPAAGKTFSIINQIKNGIYNPDIIATGFIRLGQEYANELPDYTLINTNNKNTEYVCSDIEQALNSNKKVIITITALLSLKINQLKGLTLLLDEPIGLYERGYMTLTNSDVQFLHKDFDYRKDDNFIYLSSNDKNLKYVSNERNQSIVDFHKRINNFDAKIYNGDSYVNKLNLYSRNPHWSVNVSTDNLLGLYYGEGEYIGYTEGDKINMFFKNDRLSELNYNLPLGRKYVSLDDFSVVDREGIMYPVSFKVCKSFFDAFSDITVLKANFNNHIDMDVIKEGREVEIMKLERKSPFEDKKIKGYTLSSINEKGKKIQGKAFKQSMTVKELEDVINTLRISKQLKGPTAILVNKETLDAGFKAYGDDVILPFDAIGSNDYSHFQNIVILGTFNEHANSQLITEIEGENAHHLVMGGVKNLVIQMITRTARAYDLDLNIFDVGGYINFDLINSEGIMAPIEVNYLTLNPSNELIKALLKRISDKNTRLNEVDDLTEELKDIIPEEDIKKALLIRNTRKVQDKSVRKAQDKSVRKAQDTGTRKAQDKSVRKAQDTGTRKVQDKSVRKVQDTKVRKAPSDDVIKNRINDGIQKLKDTSKYSSNPARVGNWNKKKKVLIEGINGLPEKFERDRFLRQAFLIQFNS